MLVYDRFDTTIGLVTVVKSNLGVCNIGLPGSTLTQAKEWAAWHFPGESWTQAPGQLEEERGEIQAYSQGLRREFSFALDHRNTPFSMRVLKAVSGVPFGQTDSYQGIAKRVGRSGAARAVGRAVARNPIPLVIPCHRVVGADGSLTGYGGGLELKRTLLQLEARQL